MTAAHIPDTAVGKRLAAVLFVSTSLGSAALITNSIVTPLVAGELTGTAAYAGIPGTLLLIGAASSAYPGSLLMQRYGRRPGLAGAFLVGSLAVAFGALAIVQQLWFLFLFAALLVGVARGIIDQSRYAAADANPPATRARAISTVVFASTVGAVVGPLLVGPAGDYAARAYKYSALTGPLAVGCVCFLLGGLVLWMLLRPDPRDIDRAYSGQNHHSEITIPTGSAFRQLFRHPAVSVAAISILASQVIMELVLTVTSVHMHQNQHSLSDISFIFMMHTLGMYGLSFVTGTVTDRIGRSASIVVGAVILICGCLIAPIYDSIAGLSVSVFLIGLGWNYCYIGGSSLLSTHGDPAGRNQTQGAIDFGVNLLSAIASFSTGFILAWWGFGVLCAIATIVACVPIVVTVLRRSALQGQPV
ncbi:MAG: hypothetical protein RLZZ297_813 [Chloroflexota bacterium]